MYRYNLIVKHDKLDHEAARAMANRELIRRFGPDVFYYEHAYLTHEIVIVVSHESKRTLQSVLGEWFIEPNRTEAREREGAYPTGTLLHYREILPNERLGGVLGG